MEPLSQENLLIIMLIAGVDLGICVNLKWGDRKYVHYAEEKIGV